MIENVRTRDTMVSGRTAANCPAAPGAAPEGRNRWVSLSLGVLALKAGRSCAIDPQRGTEGRASAELLSSLGACWLRRISGRAFASFFLRASLFVFLASRETEEECGEALRWKGRVVSGWSSSPIRRGGCSRPPALMQSRGEAVPALRSRKSARQNVSSVVVVVVVAACAAAAGGPTLSAAVPLDTGRRRPCPRGRRTPR